MTHSLFHCWPRLTENSASLESGFHRGVHHFGAAKIPQRPLTRVFPEMQLPASLDGQAYYPRIARLVEGSSRSTAILTSIEPWWQIWKMANAFKRILASLLSFPLLSGAGGKKFDANRDLTIHAFDGAKEITEAESGHNYRLATKGMAGRGFLELEMVGIPLEAASAAAVILNSLAGYMVTEKAVTSGQNWAHEFERTWVVARVFEVTTNGQKYFRVVDVENTQPVDQPPRVAVSTIMYEKAMAALEKGDDDTARQLLSDSVAFFPGVPTVQRIGFKEPMVVNFQNHLSWLGLSQSHEGAEREKFYRTALERSPEFLTYELGAKELPTLGRSDLEKATSGVIAAAQATQGAEPLGEKVKAAETAKGAAIMGFVPSPILEPGNEVHGQRELSILPLPFRYMFYEPPVSTHLQKAESHALIASIYLHYQKTPLDLLAVLHDTRLIYQPDPEPKQFHGVATDSKAPSSKAVGGYEPHQKALSMTAAYVGRMFAAGLTVKEILVVAGVEKGDGAGALAKLAAWQDRENGWFAATISL
jgi:hypothetical protein